MTGKSLKRHIKVQKKLARLSKKLMVLYHLRAVNAEEQRKKFLDGEIENPEFKWRNPVYNTKKFERELKKLSFSKDSLGKLERAMAGRLSLANKMVSNLGNKTVVREVSRKQFGGPSPELVERAKAMSIEYAGKVNLAGEAEKDLSPKDAAEQANRFFAKSDLRWRAVVKGQFSVSADTQRRFLKVSSQKNYSKESLKRIFVHEVFAHVFRAENGRSQELPIFAMQFPYYLSTEEGLAVYLEEKFGVSSAAAMRRHALKVVAVDCAYKDIPFRDIFDVINSYDTSDDLAWELTYRVYRGGGYLKDHSYFEGYFMIKDFVAGGGEIKDLYYGRIALEHLDLCRELEEKGLLKPPKYLPDEEVVL